MLERKIKPSDLLKPFVHHYCLIESDSKVDYFPVHRIYTYGCVVLVFHYNEPSLFRKRDGNCEIEPQTVICGQQTSYYDLALSGNTGMIFIVFKPFGAGQFFKIPMYEITNENIALEFLIQKEALEIEDKILQATSTSERIRMIEDFLLSRLDLNCKIHKQIISTFHSIYDSNGKTTVKQLAEFACLGIKQFERNFSRLIGLNPKQYLRIVRFQQILRLQKSDDFKDYTTLAQDCGYCDQSHFIHDFNSITGVTPGIFFKTANGI